jgi:hypothetical protein
MSMYRNSFCWAAAILGVAVAGMFGVIDQASMTTLLIVLPIAGWMAVRGRGSCPLLRGA